jgi:hypothetical protein
MENDERIIIDVDEQPALQGINKANAGLDSFEKKAGSSTTSASKGFQQVGKDAEQAAEVTVRSIEKTRTSTERWMKSLRATTNRETITNPVQRLMAEMQAFQKQPGISGDTKYMAESTELYERRIARAKELIAVQKQADSDAMLQKAIKASRQYEAETRKFTKATDDAAKSKAKLQKATQDAAAAQAKLNSESSKMKTPSLTSSIVQANLLTDAIQRVAGVLKNFTLGSTAYAARTEQLGLALGTVARANNVSAGTAFTLTKKIQELGVTTQDAREQMSRLIAANVDYSKAVQLASAAQDVGRISGEGTALSFGRLVHAIISAQPELLRQVGINLTFEESYKNAAKAMGVTAESLTSMEKLQIRTNDVIRAASNYAGVYADGLDSVGGRMLSLTRKIDEMRNAIGEQFQDEAAATLSILEKIANVMKENPREAVFGVGLGVAAVAGTGAVVAAGTGNPLIALGLAAVAATGALVSFGETLSYGWSNKSKGDPGIKDYLDAWAMQRDEEIAARGTKGDRALGLFGIRRNAPAGISLGTSVEDGRFIPDRDAIARYLTGNTAPAQPRTRTTPFEDKLTEDARKTLDAKFAEGNAKMRASAQGAADAQEQKRIADAAKAKEDAAKKVADAEKHALGVLRDAQAQEYNGIGKIMYERLKLLDTYGLTKKAIQDINDATEMASNREVRSIRSELIKESENLIKLEEDRQSAISDARNKRFQQDQEYAQETLDLQIETIQKQLDYQETALGRQRDVKLRALEVEESKLSKHGGVEAKNALEQQKLEIEVEYLQKSSQLHIEELQRRMDREIAAQEAIWSAGLITDSVLMDRVTALREASAAQRSQIETDATETIAAARDKATIRSAELVRDANQRAFDEVKRSFESLLDAMFSHTKSWGDAMKAILRAAVLQPLKDIAGTMFANAMTGQPVAAGVGGGRRGGGLLGMLGLGALGTSAASGGTSSAASGVAGTAGGSGKAAYAGYAAGAQSYLAQFGNIGYGPKGGDFGGEVAGSYRGVGGATGGAMLLGGAALGMDGWRRGGAAGFAELTASGALIGAKFGGPVGALIGAGVGAIIGTIRLFVKGAEDKAIKQVRSTYGVTISKDIASQVVATAKQSFGGDVALAIRSPQLRDLIELYAMSTGQKWTNGATAPTPISIAQSGGMLYQLPTYRNGAAVPTQGGLIPSVMGGGSGGGVTILSLDAQATKEVLQGQAVQVIQSQPRLVQASANASIKQNSGRREMAASLSSPGLVTV